MTASGNSKAAATGSCQVLVWNPVAGEHHLRGTPHFLDSKNWDMYYPFSPNGAVICASGDEGPVLVESASGMDELQQ